MVFVTSKNIKLILVWRNSCILENSAIRNGAKNGWRKMNIAPIHACLAILPTCCFNIKNALSSEAVNIYTIPLCLPFVMAVSELQLSGYWNTKRYCCNCFVSVFTNATLRLSKKKRNFTSRHLDEVGVGKTRIYLSSAKILMLRHNSWQEEEVASLTSECMHRKSRNRQTKVSTYKWSQLPVQITRKK